MAELNRCCTDGEFYSIANENTIKKEFFRYKFLQGASIKYDREGVERIFF